MAEMAYEFLLVALESVHGTAIDPPTHYLSMEAKITPRKVRARPKESRGTLAEYHRSKVVRKSSGWEAEGPLDVYTLPLLLRACVKGGVTPTTPGGATNARLWTFAPTMNADNLESMTLYWGDPNVQAFQSAYNFVDDLEINFDAASEELASMKVSGQGHFPIPEAPNSTPAQLNSPLIAPGNMELWLDTSLAIGTTAINGRVLGGTFKLGSNISRKWWAQGPGAALNPGGHGRGKRHVELELTFEVPDMDEYDLWDHDDDDSGVIKARVRLNGPLIEGALYHYVQFDVYGPFDSFDWGDNESTNRTITMTILSEYDITAGFDWRILVQNDRATL